MCVKGKREKERKRERDNRLKGEKQKNRRTDRLIDEQKKLDY